MQEAIALAKKLDLHLRSDKEGTLGWRLIVSRSLMTWERANLLAPGWRVDRDWVGTVAVYKDIPGLELELDHVIPWGKLSLYGDWSLIKELTGLTDCDVLLGN